MEGIMTPPIPHLRIISCLAFVALSGGAFAEPIEFSEVSLLVRARESEAVIRQEVSRRKLVRTLTPQQESILKSQGARDSLVQALRSPAIALAPAEASAFEARREQIRKAPRGDATRSTSLSAEQPQPGLHIVDVSIGHPINLSQWGGPDYEFAFNGTCRLDDGRPDAVMIDNVRSYTHTATYLGVGRPDDGTTIFDRRNYVSVMDHHSARGLRIDRHNPVSVKGLPYTLYPVYAAGGVSLYYIGESSGSVKLAIATPSR